ncbi:MAG: VOC family protein [Pseudomonadota bacterium]|nr:VOC family protein [Pseudomonadota bacterium]
MPHTPQHPVVWTEIPVTDLPRAMEFYQAVFDFALKLDETGPNPIALIAAADDSGTAGHLYPGTPAADGQGPTIHLWVPDTVEAAMKRLVAAGGTELGPVVTIPPGRFAYAQDPDGNSIGLFQPSAAT